MSASQPGPVRRAAMRAYRRLPARPSQQIVRLVAPTYTLGAIALIEHGPTLLALRQTHRKGWSLPGGLVDAGEQPVEAVAREVLEETGLRIDPGGIWTTAFDTRLRHCDIVFRVVCDNRPVVRLASEATSYDWLPISHFDDIDGATSRILRAVQATQCPPPVGRVLG
ncbi:NUDIX hydrolase [Calidifontibacter sp. DB0510]|uniref:NUDIX hydrolase n=1 Tax=Metallococcus carri TaxID=1656884 RepID=A0A967EHT3_9MICO|nr:NUDIX hydrolase [Metallococcus carri]NHN57018.1 NUDIX hydrolase [Metallococcus carri]NOP39113.1 NUDIX hydrolase [Calidifontibacter sp. DB2511S]